MLVNLDRAIGTKIGWSRCQFNKGGKSALIQLFLSSLYFRQTHSGLQGLPFLPVMVSEAACNNISQVSFKHDPWVRENVQHQFHFDRDFDPLSRMGRNENYTFKAGVQLYFSYLEGTYFHPPRIRSLCTCSQK